MNKIAAGERFGTHAFLVAYCDWARRRHQAITQDVKNLTSWFSTWLERRKQSVWILVTLDLTAQWQVSVKIVLIISLKFTTIQNNSYKILKHVLHSRHELVYLNTCIFTIVIPTNWLFHARCLFVVLLFVDMFEDGHAVCFGVVHLLKMNWQ